VKDAIARPNRLDLGKVSERLRHHDAVGQHGTFRPARRAAGVKKPGKIAGAARHHVDALALEKLSPLARAGRDGAAVRRDVVGPIRACERQRRFRVADDVAELIAVELGIHRHGDQAGVPDRKQRFEKFRPVGHGDRNAIVGLAQGAQVARERARARRPLPISRVGRAAAGDRRTIRRGAPPFLDPGRQIHRTLPALFTVRAWRRSGPRPTRTAFRSD